MSKGIKDIKIIKDARINILTGQALSNTVKEVKERHKKDLKRKFLFQLIASKVPKDNSFLYNKEYKRKCLRKYRPKFEISLFKSKSYID